jgi:hypothetical protein
MVGTLLTKMVTSLSASHPSLSLFNAYAICFAGFYNGVESAPKPEEIALSRVIRKIINEKFNQTFGTNEELADFGRAFTDTGTSGTRAPCN